MERELSHLRSEVSEKYSFPISSEITPRMVEIFDISKGLQDRQDDPYQGERDREKTSSPKRSITTV